MFIRRFMDGSIDLPDEFRQNYGSRSLPDHSQNIVVLSTTTVAKPKKRLEFIDALRAYAILMMLQGHFTDTMLGWEYRDKANVIYGTWHFMRGMTAPIFFTVTGIVFTFLLLKDGRPLLENVRVQKGIRRGFFLIFIGYLLKVNFPTFLMGWIYSTYWGLDVLHNIGIALLVLIGLYAIHTLTRWSLPLLLAGTGLTIFLFSEVWEATDWSFLPVMVENYFDKAHGSIFTPVPWVGYTLIGGALGWHLHANTALYRTYWWPALILMAGFALHQGSTHALQNLYNLTGWTNFEDLANNNWLFWRLGQVLMVVSIFIYLEKIVTFPRLFLKIGTETLTIYGAHYVLLYGTWLGVGIATFGAKQWTPIATVMGAISFLIFFAFVIQHIERIREIYQVAIPDRLNYALRYSRVMGTRQWGRLKVQAREAIDLLLARERA